MKFQIDRTSCPGTSTDALRWTRSAGVRHVDRQWTGHRV